MLQQPETSLTISFDDFLKVDIRVGTVLEVSRNAQARKPSYRLRIDFGPELGRRTSSAQLVDLYEPADPRRRPLFKKLQKRRHP